MDGSRSARVRRHLIVRGRVQGVGFRAACRRRATGLGVEGWVRNRPDGSVELVAEGSPEAVAALVEWCRSGPPGAVVTSLETVDGESLPRPGSPAGPGGFRIVV